MFSFFSKIFSILELLDEMLSESLSEIEASSIFYNSFDFDSSSFLIVKKISIKMSGIGYTFCIIALSITCSPCFLLSIFFLIHSSSILTIFADFNFDLSYHLEVKSCSDKPGIPENLYSSLPSLSLFSIGLPLIQKWIVFSQTHHRHFLKTQLRGILARSQ